MTEEFVNNGSILDEEEVRAHEFYSQVLSDSSKYAFDRAAVIHGVDGEISLLRVRIRDLVAHDPENFKAVQTSMLALDKLIKTRCRLEKSNKPGLVERVANALSQIELPPAVVGSLLKK